jgi:MarR family transcriptional regulator, temperature-dependent positive regulator of motility
VTEIERPSGAPSEPGGFRLSHSPSHLLRRAQQYIADRFADEEVTLRQTVVLAAVAENGACSQSDLVRATGVDRSTMAEMVARMEKKGLVSRTVAAADARAKAVSLTAAGRQRLVSALPAIRLMDEALLDLLPRNKRKSFQDTLGIIARAAEPDTDADADDDHRKGKRKKRRADAKASDKSDKKKKKKKSRKKK